MNKLIVLSLAYRSDEDLINFSSIGLQAAANSFQHNLLRGIKKAYSGEVLILNCLSVGTWPRQFKKILLPDLEYEICKCKCFEIGCINIPIIKQIQRSIKLKRKLEKVLEKEDGILVYSTYLPFLWAIRRVRRGKTTIIVTDLPEFYDLQKVSKVRILARKFLNRLIYKYLSKINSFVLLTEEMKYPLKVGNRPYIVIEGICDSSLNKSLDKCEYVGKEIIFYSGTLAISSGILDLIKSIEEIEIKNVELWICGKGECSKFIEEKCKKNTNIRFFGFCTKERVNYLRNQSTILVNPRRNVSSFTRYSFPSKTMEYMTSGKPIIMYKLSGIPSEYYEYMYCIDDQSVNSLKEKIEEVISIPYKDREKFAKKAKEFILSQKNEYMQSKKIITLMESN